MLPNKHHFFIHTHSKMRRKFLMVDAKDVVSPTPFVENRERCLADCCGVRDFNRAAFPSGPGLYDSFEEWITHFLQLRDQQQSNPEYSRINTSNNGNTDINYQTYTGFLLLQSMEHADTVPQFERRGSSKPVSIRTLSMSFCFCFGVQPRQSQISMLRAYAFCISAGIALCPSPVLVVG